MTEQTKPVEEEPEGLDGAEDSSLGDYPIDTFLIRTENRTVHDVLRRVDQDSYILNPEFQRDFIWPEDKQSKLIESVLMRIPLPVFYLAENKNGDMIVVDGLQRISTFHRFVNNKLRLKLPHQKELNKKTFSALAPKLQNRIEDCPLILYIIDAKIPDRAQLDIFERVNSGLALTRQQMRNSLYMGPATRFLKVEASSSLFVDTTGRSLDSDKMRDREFVNRFCAFHLLTESSYKGNMDDFLAACLIEMNKLQNNELGKLKSLFRRSLANNKAVFNEHSFRKHTKGQSYRNIINASLWDVMSTGLSIYQESLVEARANKLRNSFFKMLEEDEFNTSITYGTNQVKRVRYRFNRSREMFQGVFDDK